MTSISGFLIVRLPEFNYLVKDRDVIPTVNGVFYSGVRRAAWADVFDANYYEGKIPENVQKIAKTIKSSDFTGLDLCTNESDALELLNYANRNSKINEIIAVRSPQLQTIKGTIYTQRPIHWIGFDFVALGEWSIIEAGIFRYPKHYYAWMMRLNQHGLFNDPLLLSDYEKTYESSVDLEKAEPLATDRNNRTAATYSNGSVAYTFRCP